MCDRLETQLRSRSVIFSVLLALSVVVLKPTVSLKISAKMNLRKGGGRNSVILWTGEHTKPSIGTNRPIKIRVCRLVKVILKAV